MVLVRFFVGLSAARNVAEAHGAREDIERINGFDERYEGWGQIWDVLSGDAFLQGLKVSVLLVLFVVPLGLALGVLLAVTAQPSSFLSVGSGSRDP